LNFGKNVIGAGLFYKEGVIFNYFSSATLTEHNLTISRKNITKERVIARREAAYKLQGIRCKMQAMPITH